MLPLWCSFVRFEHILHVEYQHIHICADSKHWYLVLVPVPGSFLCNISIGTQKLYLEEAAEHSHTDSISSTEAHLQPTFIGQHFSTYAMTSGFGIRGGLGRCYHFWADFKECKVSIVKATKVKRS